MLTATFNGKTVSLYKDAELIVKKDMHFDGDNIARVSVGPVDPWEKQNRFAGNVREFTIRRGALTDGDIKALFAKTQPANP